MATDLCYLGDADELCANVARRLGYKVLVTPRVTEAKLVGEVTFLPRRELSRASVRGGNDPRGLRVLVVESKEDLKAYPKLAGRVDSIRVDFESVGEVDKGFVRRVVGLGVPVEVEFLDVVERMRSGKPLDYYLLLLRLYARGKIKVYVCSGARDPWGLAHPLAMSALLTLLGVPEELALKAALKIPGDLASRGA